MNAALAGWAAFGLFVGAYGTLVGAGGGFLLVPALLWAAGVKPEVAAGTSLAVVLFNAISGTWAYARKGLVDWRTALLFAASTVPGSWLGPSLLHFVPEKGFYAAFGTLMLVIAGILLLRPASPPEGGKPRLGRGALIRGCLLSLVVGFLSSMLGIGGGVIHVPVLIYALGFPAHLAVATSHATLAFSAGVGVISHHLARHVLWDVALAAGAGALVGAQIGAALSRRAPTRLLVRLLALAIVAVGVRCLWMGLATAPASG